MEEEPTLHLILRGDAKIFSLLWDCYLHCLMMKLDKVKDPKGVIVDVEGTNCEMPYYNIEDVPDDD